MALPDTLKALRVSRNLRQQDIADILGIKRPTYASYETGRVEMDSELLQKLANYYSTTVDALLKGYGVERKDFKILRPSTDEFMNVSIAEWAMLKAVTKALTDKVINLEKRLTKKPYDEKISRDLQKSILEDYNHILDELLNKKIF